MYTFNYLDSRLVDWNLIESSYDSTVFHSKQWMEFLSTIKLKPFVISINKDDVTIGHFVGEKLFFGIRCICAPPEGTGTYTQGLCFSNQIPEDERVVIYQELAHWIFSNHLAAYIQVDDWQLRKVYDDWVPQGDDWHHDVLDKYNIRYTVRPTLFLDLKKSEQDLWGALHYKSCKYSINKAQKLGLRAHVINKFDEIDAFTQIHYAQVCDVNKRHHTYPKVSQSQARMEAVCKSLFPNRVLMVEVIGPDEGKNEQIMATGIFVYDKGECQFFTAASFAHFLKYSPNELLVWTGIKELCKRGCGELNFGGMSSYKLKYGTQYAYVPKIYFYKFEFIFKCKHFAFVGYHRFREIVSKLLK